MLEKVDLTMKMEKSEYKAKMTALKLQMGKLQRQCKEMGLPIMIVFEGFDAAGKGMQIGKLIQSLDPRGFEVFTVKEETKEEAMHPFLWRFWTKTPQRGRMAVYDGSWYIKVLSDRFEKKMRESEIENCYRSICSFEKQITEDGTLLIKLFLDIDQKEQKKRFDKLMESKDTAWRVTKADLKKNEKYDQYQEMIEEMLQRTDTEYAPWTIVEATDRRYATVKIYTVITQMLTAGIDNRRREIARETAAEVIREAEKEASENRSLIDGATKGFQESVLAKVDLSLCCDRKTYRKKLKEYQKKIEKLHGELYQKRIPVVIGFEGWDAAGKGGAIKRLTEKMDARGYVVNPTAAPNDLEKAHHYLWRFWKNMPKDGHIAIFDRTWYGRVMVERIEGFCTQEEWKRAYKEINDIAKTITDTLSAEAMMKVRVAYGTVVEELKDVSKSYKEAAMALDVGRIFYSERTILAYNELGIGRLIHQLPVSLCEMFLQEVFTGDAFEQFDEETLVTVYKFFDNNLNVSETARQLYIHRNTLVYRLEKIQKSTGLDVRVFDDALTFKIAMMVASHIKK